MDPWKVKNDRRLDLIRLKFSVGLDDEESAELESLKHEIYSYMQTIDPRQVKSVEDIAVLRTPGP